MRQFLEKVVDFLHGRKATILGLVLMVNTFLVKEGLVSVNAAALIQGIISLLGVGADIATSQLGVSNDKLGSRRS